MGSRFVRQVLIDGDAAAASAQRIDDLPVNPLSVILFTLRVQTSAANTLPSVANILAAVANVEVLYQGSAVIAASLSDLAAMYTHLTGRGPWFGRTSDGAANANDYVTVPILLGRKPFWLKECFPATRRGELSLRTTMAAAFTNIGTVTLQVETVELLEGKPDQFLKYTTISKTPTATGDHDTDLPIGNRYRGILLFGTTVPVDASLNKSISKLRLLLDNVEYDYAKANWESLHGDSALRAAYPYQLAEHIHRENTAGAYTQNAATGAGQIPTSFLRQYAFLDFDPLVDDVWLIDTKGLARVFLRITADVADAIRVIPCELVSVGGTASP